MTQEKCDRQLLRDACHRIARTMLSATRPDDFARIQAVPIHCTVPRSTMRCVYSTPVGIRIYSCAVWSTSRVAMRYPPWGRHHLVPHRLEVVLDLVTPSRFDILEDNSFLRDLGAASQFCVRISFRTRKGSCSSSTDRIAYLAQSDKGSCSATLSTRHGSGWCAGRRLRLGAASPEWKDPIEPVRDPGKAARRSLQFMR